MRFMMLMIPNMPDEARLDARRRGRRRDDASTTRSSTKAGVLLALDGLHPAAKGARVSFAGGRPSVTDGPFAEAKEVVGGYWLIQAQLEGGGGRVGLALPRRARAT